MHISVVCMCLPDIDVVCVCVHVLCYVWMSYVCVWNVQVEHVHLVCVVCDFMCLFL